MPFVERESARPDTRVWLARPDGRCAFFDRTTDGASCRVHAALGHTALPLACRQFPRITVRDPRGPAITLSHYCPTAAALLEPDSPVAVITDAPGFPSAGEYVGLEARDALPPLLRPDMAMDWASWWALERLAVDLLGNGHDSVDRDLARLRGIVEHVRAWNPTAGPLSDRIARGPAVAAPSPARAGARERLQSIREAIPEELRPGAPTAPSRADLTSEGTRRRFLAAHAFANWTAYLGLDLRAWLASIEAADACITSGWSVREADLLLRHLADPWRLADRLSRDEAGATSLP